MKIFIALLLLVVTSPSFAAESDKESAFERVMRTGVLRCGYWNWPPLFSEDSATGEKTGIFYDLMAYIGPSLGLKVEWTAEVGFATFEQDLITGKVDAICAGVWPKAARSRVMEFSDAVFYNPLQIYVRADDKRFDNNIAALNDATVTFASMDGLADAAIAAQDFPKAKRVSLPDTASISEIFLMVVSKKADAFITDPFTAGNYLTSNPGTLRIVPSDRPLRFFGNTISANKGEHELINMLNIALEEAQSAGFTDSLVTKYEVIPNSLLRAAKPYRTQP